MKCIPRKAQINNFISILFSVWHLEKWKALISVLLPQTSRHAFIFLVAFTSCPDAFLNSIFTSGWKSNFDLLDLLFSVSIYTNTKKTNQESETDDVPKISHFNRRYKKTRDWQVNFHYRIITIFSWNTTYKFWFCFFLCSFVCFA